MLKFASHPFSYITNCHAKYVQTILYQEETSAKLNTATGLKVSCHGGGGTNVLTSVVKQ